jgi:hypothetical protein
MWLIERLPYASFFCMYIVLPFSPFLLYTSFFNSYLSSLPCVLLSSVILSFSCFSRFTLFSFTPLFWFLCAMCTTCSSIFNFHPQIHDLTSCIQQDVPSVRLILTDHGLDRMFWKGKGAFILGSAVGVMGCRNNATHPKNVTLDISV